MLLKGAPLNRTTIRRAVAVATAGLLLAAGLSACSSRAGANEIYLYYKAGVGDNREFAECIEPGKAGSYPVDDEIFALPTDKRTWNIQPVDGADDTNPIVAGSLPKPILDEQGKQTGTRTGPAVNVWLTTDFYLNWDCDTEKNDGRGDASSPVVQFFERTGRTAQISDDAGTFNIENWRTMLRTTLATVQRDILQAETRKWDADDLDANTGDVYAKMEAALGPAFQKALNAKMGGEYFCGVEFAGGAEVQWIERTYDPKTGAIAETPKKGSCPPVRIDITNIDMNDPGIAAARNEAYIAEQRAERDKTEAQSRVEVANTIKNGGAGAAEIQRQQYELEIEKERTRQVEACAKSGAQCTVVVGGATGINVGRR